jgi:enoyl-CoA hydratase
VPDDAAAGTLGAGDGTDLWVTWPSSRVARLELSRPDRLNALTSDLVLRLTDTVTRITRDSRCRVLVITGAGRGFCSGLDLASTAEGSQGQLKGVADRLGGQQRFVALMRALRSAPVPVIAAVNGPAAGAGFALALNSDARIASSDATFHVASVRIGLSAGECGISYLLPRLIGAARAFPILLSGRPIDAAEAERIGLVTSITPTGTLQGAAIELAESFAANSPYAVTATKQLMWANMDATFELAIELENRAQILGTYTADAAEAKQAFIERRSPTFTGR